MKYKGILIVAAVIILPFLMLVLSIYELFKIDDGYPFNSEFFSTFSIYASKEIYIGYLVLFSLILIAAIISAFRMRWKLYLVFLILSIALFIYPLFSND